VVLRESGRYKPPSAVLGNNKSSSNYKNNNQRKIMIRMRTEKDENDRRMN
jgi:hypothetical protein